MGERTRIASTHKRPEYTNYRLKALICLFTIGTRRPRRRHKSQRAEDAVPLSLFFVPLRRNLLRLLRAGTAFRSGNCSLFLELSVAVLYLCSHGPPRTFHSITETKVISTVRALVETTSRLVHSCSDENVDIFCPRTQGGRFPITKWGPTRRRSAPFTTIPRTSKARWTSRNSLILFFPNRCSILSPRGGCSRSACMALSTRTGSCALGTTGRGW